MAHLFWKYRKPFLILLGLVVVILASFVPRVKPDNSLEALSMENDAGYNLMKRVEKSFGSEEFISISFAADNIFAKESLQSIDAITEFLSKIDGIDNIMSLTNIWQLNGTTVEGEETLVVSNLLQPEWIATGVPATARQNILDNPLYKKLIYSPDGKATAIIAQLKVLENDDAKRSEIIDQIRPFIEKLEKNTGQKIHIFGYPIYHRAIFGTIETEQKTQTPLMIFAVALLMYFSYRSFFISISPILLMVVVFTFVLGALGIFGINLNWLTSAVPAVIMIVSVCDTMHVINIFLSTKYKGEATVKEIFNSIGPPSLIAASTTAVGFASMTLTPIKVVREFGLYSAFGVVVAFLLTFSFYILILHYGPTSFKKTDRHQAHRSVTWLLEKSLWCIENHANKIFIVSFCIVAVACYGATKIVADTATFGILKNDPFELSAANDFISRGAGGGAECYVFLESETPGAFYDPETLRMVEGFEHNAEKKAPEVVKSLSIVDFIKYFNQAVHNNDPAFYRIPDTRAEVASLFLLMEMERDRLQLDSFINRDYSQTRLRFFTTITQSNKRVLELADITQDFINETVPPNFKASFTGRPFITAKVIDYLPSTMWVSIICSALVIGVLLIILFRSVTVGLIAMLDNILTIIIGMGVMGFFGIKLDVATCMVFSVALGIADDDTIHLVWHLKKNVESGLDYKTALRKTFDEVGVPLVTSTLVLVGGFLMLTISNNWPITMFGILVAICCVTALVVDLLLTATLFMKIKPFRDLTSQRHPPSLSPKASPSTK